MSKYVNLLKQADIFYKLTPSQVEMIAGICEERVYSPGELVFPEGASSDELYVILEGEVEILINPGLVSVYDETKPALKTISTLRRGESFGEVALVDQGLRSASVRVGSSNARLALIPREKLIQLCESYPQLGYRLMRNLASDLAFKIRTLGLHMREEILYGTGEKQARKFLD